MMNPFQFMQQLQQFASNFQGDPRQKVQELMQNGQMSQQTYSQYSKVAEMFTNGNQQGALSQIFGSGNMQP